MIPCDLCGSENPSPVLESPRLGGPLVRCRQCGLFYVGERRSDLTFGPEAAAATTERIRDANRDLKNLSLDEEHRLAQKNARMRLQMIRKYRTSGRLLEVGCARGDFLRVARDQFTVSGVEPNAELAEEAAAVAPVHQGLIETFSGSGYDVAVSFHVIEHTDSPRRFLAAIGERLSPGGLVVLETPNINSVPFRVLKSRWRQFIPEHYFFFDEKTMRKLLEDAGFSVEEIRRIGKFASPALILNRLARYFRPLRVVENVAARMNLQRLTIPVDPLDIMIAVGSKAKDGRVQTNRVSDSSATTMPVISQ
jgi:2-polyprenyl-3-methyl-5-hydroxy-6-metoxy-1,4-benzoquinol methylase